MKKTLITGVPFSGKSHLHQWMIKRGFNSFDTDEIKGLGKWVNKTGSRIDVPLSPSLDWLHNHSFLWDTSFLQSWLSNFDKDIYIFGTAANVWDASYLFDRHFYLKVSSSKLKTRFKKKFRQNRIGKTIEHQYSILTSLPKHDSNATVLEFEQIDASLSVNQIIQQIIK